MQLARKADGLIIESHGIGVTALDIRTEGTQGTELLAQAVAAFRSALEVRTREQLPQQWAGTQNNLGNTFKEQAIRTEGTQSTDYPEHHYPNHKS